MKTQRDLDALLTSYLAEGMTVLPDRVADAVVGEAHRTRRRTMVGPWRTASVLRAAFGATAVLVVLAIAVGLLDMRGKTNVAAAPESTQPGASASVPADTPTPEPTPTPGPTPTATPLPTVEPSPAPALITWTSRSFDEDWPAPLRVESPGAGVVPDGSHGNYTDALGDTTPDYKSEVDIVSVNAFLGCQAGLPKLRCIEMALSGQLPDPLPQPADAWYAYGIVLDVDSDGVPDYRYGVDNTPPEVLGADWPSGRIWRADLRTGEVVVVTARQASDDTLLAELPGSFPVAFFHIKGLGGRFYGWSSLIADGRVVATDYAPDVGWLELVNK
jgi:hypothetical protein